MLAENSLVHLIGEIFHPVFVVVATVLAAIYGVIPSYGVAVILLTIVVMGLLTPLTVRSTKSIVAMQRLQPEITRLRQKYKGPEKSGAAEPRADTGLQGTGRQPSRESASPCSEK